MEKNVTLLDFGLEVLFFLGCALDRAGLFCVFLFFVYIYSAAVCGIIDGWVGLTTYGNDIFVAFAERLESAWRRVLQEHNVLVRSSSPSHLMRACLHARGVKFVVRTCLCTAAHAAVVAAAVVAVAAVVKPEWARERRTFRGGFFFC